MLKGQPLTRGNGRTLPVHASTSGTISAISRQVTAHPSGLPELCISTVPDQQDCWGERHPLPDYRAMTPPALIDHIHQAGIAGLGGAGFPTAAKLNGGADRINTLIINAAECEPYITADDRLMREHAAEIVSGCAILSHILAPERVLIGIEDNKPQAIAALRHALQCHEKIQLRVIPTKYPSGGAKQLIKILTGMEVPHGRHSASIGVLMQNVATVYAIKRAVIDGEPLIERVVTLTGEQMHRPGNVWAAIGTPVKHLLQNGGLIAQNKHPMVIMGGPLMGFTLSRLGVPVVKITNCILTPSRDEFSVPQAEQPCIRCGACADVCPARLLPQQLYWFSQARSTIRRAATIYRSASSVAPVPTCAPATSRWCSTIAVRRPRSARWTMRPDAPPRPRRASRRVWHALNGKRRRANSVTNRPPSASATAIARPSKPRCSALTYVRRARPMTSPR